MNLYETMKKVQLALSAVLAVFVMCSNSWATTYYVDKNHRSASNSNTGTSENLPWATIQHAADTMTAGDTTYVKAGTYSECVSMRTSGSLGNPITFQNYGTDTVTVDGTSCSTSNKPVINWVINGPGYDYIVWDGIDVQNGAKYGIWVEGDHNTIQNCKIHDHGMPSVDGACCITVMRSNFVTIANNEVYNSGWNGISAGDGNYGTISGNIIHGFPDHVGINMFPNQNGPEGNRTNNNITNNTIYNCKHGIYSRNQENYEISNNLIYEIAIKDGGGGFGIHISYYDPWAHTYQSNGKIYNNTIVDNEKYAIYNVAATNLTINNNIFAYNTTYDIYTTKTSNIVLDYNVYYSPKAIYWNGSVYNTLSDFYRDRLNEQHGVIGDPLFTDRSSADYTPTPASNNVIDKGKDLTFEGITTDINGNPRPFNFRFDIGAYEFTSGDLLPPNDLKIVAK